jgi:MoxR-like ATPase
MTENYKENAIIFRDMFGKLNYEAFCGEFSKVMYGLNEARDMMVCCLLSGGHLLLDGAPGQGKTMFANVIASLTDMKYRRLQLTGDSTSDDVSGIEIAVPIMRVNLHERDDPSVPLSAAQASDNKNRVLETLIRVGLFGDGTELILLDEVSRWSPDAVSATFSALEEKYITVGGQEFKLEELITAVMTRNTFDFQGVRKLSAAFLDRIALSIMVPRPDFDDEVNVACQPKNIDFKEELKQVWKKEDILKIRQFASSNYFFDPKGPIARYATRLVRATDPHIIENEEFVIDRKQKKGKTIYMGASSRALKTFMGVATVYVHGILGELTVYPEHLQTLAHMILRHRLNFKVASEAQGLREAHRLTDEIINSVPILG